MLKLVCPNVFIKKISHFKHSKITGYHPTDGPTDGRTDGPTDRRTDGPTDGRTDTPSYRDGWIHLKTSILPKAWAKSAPFLTEKRFAYK